MTRIGSLFTGYGGLDMAVQAVLGGDVAWYSEIEPAACTVLAAHYPGVPNLGDITTVTWQDVEPVDVLTGGYPCQPFSHAGKRKGKHDERHLWPYVRNAIGALRPDLAVLENVAGHLTLGFADVLADLASLGWDAEWGTLRAADAGAPHGRNRLWIIAYPARTERRSAQHAGLASCAWSSQLGERPSAPADTDSRGYGGGKSQQQWQLWLAQMQQRHRNGNGHGRSLFQELLGVSTRQPLVGGNT